MSARWGKPHHDKRDWPAYNESLVLRGEFYLDLRHLRNWSRELAAMNLGKRGGQFQVPESFVRWLVIWKQLVDHRGLEGMTRRMVQLGLIPRAPDYTTLWHRLHALTPEVRLPEYRDLEVASDGTGLKTTNAGEYRIFRYGDPDARQRKHLVVVITADVRRKKVIGIEVHIEGKGHSKPRTATSHVREVTRRGYRVRKFYGERAFDTVDRFAALHETAQDPVIKIAKNAVATSTHRPQECKHRLRAIREYQAQGYTAWEAGKHYGSRWPGTQGTFSAVMRKFGENVVSPCPAGVIAEGQQRIWAHDELRELGERALRGG